MTELRERTDRIADTVAAYEEFKRVFTVFAGHWKEKCGEILGVAFAEMEKSVFYLSMFDGATVKVGFSIVIDKQGDPWGRVVYERDEMEIGRLYFDQGGFVFSKPQRQNSREGTQLNITHLYRFPEIMIEFMEKYLNAFKEK